MFLIVTLLWLGGATGVAIYDTASILHGAWHRLHHYGRHAR